MRHVKIALACIVASCMTLLAGGSVVPVGTYLYANLDKVSNAPGALEIHFNTKGPKRLVIAYGQKYRKMRKDRDGTTEEQRENYKPRLAKLGNDGQIARFDKLPPDYYDIIVVDDSTMTIHEGISLHHEYEQEAEPDKDTIAKYQEEIRKSLGLRTDRIGGWEGFFDNKQIERIEIADVQSGVLMQQMRLGTALAESGEVLKGCIHSIDVVWVERTRTENNDWQVINRQQLYRDEIPARTFFKHIQLPEMTGIRVGRSLKKLNINLPEK